MTAAMERYYRVQAPDSDPAKLLHPSEQVSQPWGERGEGPCDKCDGSGRTQHECESCKAAVDEDCPSCSGKVAYERECPACGGTGVIEDAARRGVSVFPDEDGLYRYMIKREGRLADRMLVVLEGTLSEDEDIDADEGALLVRPTRIVETRDVDMDCVRLLRQEIETEAA